jgi:hypothetical protein
MPEASTTPDLVELAQRWIDSVNAGPRRGNEPLRPRDRLGGDVPAAQPRCSWRSDSEAIPPSATSTFPRRHLDPRERPAPDGR